MITDKSILLIGNGGSLIGSNLGKKIDEFDEIIRINEGKTKGWEQDAGMKFTTWITFNPEKKFNKFINGYRTRGYSDEEIKSLLKDIHEIWYVAPRFDLLIPWHFNTFISGDIIKRHLSPITLRKMSRIIKEPTTGFIMIYLLNEMYDKFYITGFDFLGHSHLKPKYHHYFTDNPLENAERKEIEIRDLDGEYAFTKKLIEDNRIEYLAKDAIIEESKYIGKSKIQRTLRCGHTSEYYWWENNICHYCEGI